MKLSAVRSGWNRAFHSRESPVVLGLFRALFGAVLTLNVALMIPDASVWFGEDGVLPREISQQFIMPNSFDILRLLPKDDGWMLAFLWLVLAAGVCVTIGLFSRLASVVLFLGLLALHNRNVITLSAADTIFRVFALLLALSPSGAAFSVDRLIRIARGREAGRPPRVPSWSLRLLRFQTAVIYLSTAMLKLWGPDWRNGMAVYYTSRIVDLQRFPLPEVLTRPPLVRVLTLSSLAIEAALGTLIWFDELRYPVLVLGILLHLGIEYSMNLGLFEWAMMVVLVTFVEPRHVERARALVAWKLRRRWPQRAALGYDGACALCTRRAALVRALDVLHRVRLFRILPAALPEAMPSGLAPQAQEPVGAPRVPRAVSWVMRSWGRHPPACSAAASS